MGNDIEYGESTITENSQCSIEDGVRDTCFNDAN